MTAAIASDFRERLAKIAALLGSDHDGEVLAAARTAHRMVIAAGLRWQDVIVGADRPAALGDDAAAVDICLAALNTSIFDDVEKRFVASIAAEIRRDRQISERQREWLRALAERAEIAREAHRG